MEENMKKVLLRLQRQCVAREYCLKDISDKALKALEGDADAASEVVESLVKDGFVSDKRYATAFAREKSSLSGWGSVKISFALRGKGIDKEVITEALKEIDFSAAEKKLASVAMQKYKSLRDDPQRRIKLLKFLLGRGYSYDEAAAAVSKAESSNPE